MNVKRGIIWGIVGVVVICLIAVIATAASIGGEASKLDGLLKQNISSHATYDAVKQQLSMMGYSLAPPASANLNGTGPNHSLVVYRTWLTVNVDFDQTGTETGYHIDRAQAWF